MRKQSSVVLIGCVVFLLAAIHGPAQGVKPPRPNIVTGTASTGTVDGIETLPLWRYDVIASRDGLHHPGIVVGRDPFTDPGPVRIRTVIVPLIVRTHSIATSYDPTTGLVTTMPGLTVFDPTAHDAACLTAPHDVPLDLLKQSPLLSPASFQAGPTQLGTTQYVDAFQRANFWGVLGANSNYHVLLDPVVTLDPMVIDVPANEGLMQPHDFPIFPTVCGPIAELDSNWMDAYFTGTILPAVKEQGVDARSLIILLTANTINAASPVTDYNLPAFYGYHSVTGQPLMTQPYLQEPFDVANGLNSLPLSHEIAEWMNDPYATNEAPNWNYFFGGCSNLYEVADPFDVPLTYYPSVTMPNGFTYSMEELSFFSWAFGGPSLGVNGWYSNNGTFTTDAGPLCP